MANIDYQAAAAFVFALSLIALTLLLVTGWLEMRRKREDELEQFRRTIEAMRRLEQQDGDNR